MKKKGLIRGIVFVFLCCVMILGFRTDAKAAGNYYIKINKGTNVVTVYTNDDKPYTAFICSAGYATPIGTFYTVNKYTWWILDGPSYGQYCTQIVGNYLFHSVWYYQQVKTAQSYVQYNRLGTLASHGCVRLTTSAAKWIYDNCPLQTKVIIFNGTAKDDPLGKPDFIHVSTTVSTGWDPTDPDPANPYATRNTQPKIKVSSHKVKVQYKSKFKPVAMTAYDSAGNKLDNRWIRVTGSVDTGKMGSYKVTYDLTDSFGRDTSETVTYEVGDIAKATISGVRTEITKEYNSTLDLRRGITAKNVYGTVLTDKIVTKIKKPGAAEYKGMTSPTLKMRYVGTYRIMYYLKNPTNKLVTKKYMKVVVKDTKTPVFSSTDDFADLQLETGTKSITYKELLAGVTANLVSGKNMDSKISIKVTDPSGKTTTVAKNGTYELFETGNYTVTYYCSNSEKSLSTGSYKVAKKTRRLILAEPVTVSSISHSIQAPADAVVASGFIVNVLDGVKAVTVTVMSDPFLPQQTTETTDGITYSVVYRPQEGEADTAVFVDTTGMFVAGQAGTYTITYSFTGSNGETVSYVRTLTVAVLAEGNE